MFPALLAAAVAACPDLEKPSPDGGGKVMLRVWNDTARPVELDWIDFSGKRSQPRRLDVGERYTVYSYEGHRFAFFSDASTCVGTVTASKAAPLARLSPEGVMTDPRALAAMFEKRTVAGHPAFIDKRALQLPEMLTLLDVIAKRLPECERALAAHGDVLKGVALRIGAGPDAAHGATYGEGEVNIRSASQFLHLLRGSQPMALCHELAHAVNQLEFNGRNDDVVAAYREALRSEVYQHVPQNGSQPKRAYALTNADEYFAETTEAYFGYNDFYPHTREDLQRFDPTGYALMVKIWGQVGPTPELSAYPCGKARYGLGRDDEETSLRFENRGGRPVELWLLEGGRKTAWGTLESGEVRSYLARVGDVVQVTADECLEEVVAGPFPSVVVAGGAVH